MVVLLAICSGASHAQSPQESEPDPPTAEKEAELEIQDPDEGEDLMGLDDLLALEVETVSIASKQESRLDLTAAAVSKLTSDDLIRMGIDSIADSLRAVPGAVIGRVGRAYQGVNIRGPAELYARHLLVARDGRPIYTQTFSGVQWEREDYLLRDIDSIEVIRGPGGTIWGSNAVQGVINIVTKSAFDTLGWHLGLGVGSHERFRGELRYGEMVSDDTAMRVYGKWFHRDGFPLIGEETEYGNHSFGMAGFRVDSRLNEHDELTISGEYAGGRSQTIFASRTPSGTGGFLDRDSAVNDGAHLLGTWRRALDGGSSLDVTAYFDWKDLEGEFAREELFTGAIDATHSWKIDERWQFTYGGDVRLTHASYRPTLSVSFPDTVELVYLLGAFGQITYMAIPDELWLTVGTKIEHHERSGFEYQPSVRASWHPYDEHTFWGAASRAVRTPGAIDQNLDAFLNLSDPVAPGFGPTVLNLIGDPNHDSEVSHILELGWRWKPASNLAFDLTTFVQTMNGNRVAHQQAPNILPALPPVASVPLLLTNGAHATTLGVEAGVTWRPYTNWKLTGWYSWSKLDFEQDDHIVSGDEDIEGLMPRHSAHLRSDLDLTDALSWNVSAWYRSRLSSGAIGSLTRLDTSFRWQPEDGIEVSLGGRNLLEKRNPEVTPVSAVLTSSTEREFWLALDFSF